MRGGGSVQSQTSRQWLRATADCRVVDRHTQVEGDERLQIPGDHAGRGKAAMEIRSTHHAVV